MKAVEYDISINQNAAFLLRVTLNDENGDPIDLSAYAGEFVIRKTITSPTAVLRATSGDGHLTFAATGPNVVASLTGAQTDALPTGNREVHDWVYEILIWDPADEPNTALRFLYGTVHVSPSAARPDDP